MSVTPSSTAGQRIARAARPVPLLAALLLLQACAWTPHWFGKTSETPKVPVQGNRVSVLTFDKPLQVSDSLASVKVDVPSPYLNVNWPGTAGFTSHTMYNLRGPAQFKKLWSVSAGTGGEIGSRVVMSPIVVDGKIFTMDTDVRVSAFDARSGRGLWRTALAISAEKPQVGFGGGLTFSDGHLYVATGFGDVFSVNPDTGAIEWRAKLDEPFRSAPTAFGGRVFVTSFTDQLFALDAKDGHVIWNYRAIEETAHILSETSPAVAGDSVVAPFSSGQLVAFLTDNGQETWEDSLTRSGRLSSISTMNDIAGSPVIDNGDVFAISHSGRMVAIDLRSGQRIWTQEISSIETPWVAGDFIFVVTTDAKAVCLYRRDGSIKWINQLKAYRDPKTRKNPIVWSGPIMVGGKLLLVDSHERGAFLDPETGKTVKTFAIPDKVYTAPVVASDIVYIYSNDGDLIAFGDPATAGRPHPSEPRVKHVAKPDPGEIPKPTGSFWHPHTPDWFPVF